MRQFFYLFFSVTATLLPITTFGQTPSKQDFVSALEKYYYSTLALEKVVNVGCSKHIVGFPVGFSSTSVRAELMQNTPQGAQKKVIDFTANPSYASAINQQLSWMDAYKSKADEKKFQGMCADFGGQRLIEWREYRKDFFRVAAYFR